MTQAIKIPHLIESESVRAEAASQHGGLEDAAALQQSWRANLDPNVEATALKKVNVEETEKIGAELYDSEEGSGTAYDKLSEHLGTSDHGYTIQDAAVRGHALSLVVTDSAGNPKHLVVPYTDKYKSIGMSPAERAARANAEAESGRGTLGREAMQLVDQKVAEAREQIMADAAKMFAEKLAEVEEQRAQAQEEAEQAAEDSGDQGGSSRSGRTRSGGSQSDQAASYPRTHEGLDGLLDTSGTTRPDGWDDMKVDDKVDYLRGEGVSPSGEE